MTVEAIQHFFSDGVYAKMMVLEEGHIALTHQHKYSHLSILAQGEVLVECDGLVTHYTAPTCVEIKAGINHQIQAIKHSVWFCVHHVDGEYNENNIDEVLIKECEPCLG